MKDYIGASAWAMGSTLFLFVISLFGGMRAIVNGGLTLFLSGVWELVFFAPCFLRLGSCFECLKFRPGERKRHLGELGVLEVAGREAWNTLEALRLRLALAFATGRA
jgi:hypothetical protein